MQEVLPPMGIEFEVLYMAWTEPGRYWPAPELKAQMEYKYNVCHGLHPTINGMYAHFNPGLAARLAFDKYDIVVVGGLGSPSHWISGLVARSNALKVLSVESNPMSVRRSTGLAALFKQYIIRQYDAYQVTGPPALEYVRMFAPDSTYKSVITLPNIVDENVYIHQVREKKQGMNALRSKYGIMPNMQMWFCPARLEPFKGLDRFLPHMEMLKGVKLVIAGSGSQHKQLVQLVQKHSLEVDFCGHLSTAEIAEHYAAADLFVLPSMRDSSPLSPIEAMAAGLPLLVSDRIGNLEDVLASSKGNGWSFSPVGPDRLIKSLLHYIASLNRTELHSMGLVSQARYSEVFDTRACIRAYADQLLAVLDNKDN